MLYWHASSLHKKGNHGIGILFIFIAVMLIAVSVSGFAIYKANQMAQDGQEAYKDLSGNFRYFQIIDVSGYDGRDQVLTALTVDAKLIGDSAPMDLRRMSLSIGEETFQTTLRNRGDDAPVENSNRGYNTWSVQEFGELITGTNYLLDIDLDDDGQDDYIRLNNTHVTFLLSNGTSLSYALGTDLSAPTTINFNEFITGGERYGTLLISGTTTQPGIIDEAVTFEFTPYLTGNGYYVVEHLIRSDRSRNGYMVPGDVVRFHLETYQPIDIDAIIDVRFMYHDLEAIAKKVYVGNTFPNSEKVSLWPKP